MKSVLLGGLKVFLVNDGGKPLSAPGGRARFFVAGTSTPEPVYADIDLTEATALGPVVYTDELGYLPAIWLKTDRLYKVRVEQKLPGTPEVWSLLWEVDNVGYIDPHESEEPGEPQITVDSITALKAVDHSAHSVVMVDGYYSAGDFGTPSTFVWSATSTRHDDGGSVIRPNDVASGDAGRWLQVFSGDVIDVRKFGAIPDLTENSDVTAKVVNAINYAQQNSTRSRPLTVAFLAPGKYEFGGDFDFTQYADFVDLSDNSHHKLNWLICEDVVFKGDSSDFTLSNNTVCLTREALIEGTSATLSIEGGGSIKVDPAWWGDKACSVSDCYVECHSVTTNNKRFERCSVKSNRMFGTGAGYVTLVEMNFNEEWFASDFDWSHLVLNDTTISVYDCFSADSYIDIKNAQNEADYGDLGEQEVHDAVFLDNAIAENFFGTATCRGSAEIHNASATLAFTGSVPSLNAIDSWLTVSASGPFTTLSIRRGQIASSDTVSVLTAARLDDVDIDAPLSILGGRLDCNGCRINRAISHIGNPVVENVRGCVFNAQIQIRGGGTDVAVNAVWQDNVGNVADPISIDKTNLAILDSAHSYTYSGNSGTFLPADHAKFTHTLNFTDSFATATQNDDYVMLTKDSTDAPPSVHFRNDASYENQNPTFNHGFSGAVSLFRVGRDAFPVRVDWRVLSTSAGNMQQLAFNIAPVSFRMLMSNAGGMEWNCYVYKAAYSAQGANTYDTHIAIGLLNFATLTNVSVTGAFEAVR